MDIKIGNRLIGENHPTYFIADIAQNHDGDIDRAKELIRLAKENGADAAKFQNFRAEKIVSDYGFRTLESKMTHQSKWKKSVFETYQDYSLPFEWTKELKDTCDAVGIEYFSTPYDFGAIDMLEPVASAYKIGSGDITWLEALEKIAKKNKPVLLATGASNIGEVQEAVNCILKFNKELILLQCNSNYSASPENFKHIHLRVLQTYRAMYPNMILGLSDHTLGHATVLGAIALGARVIEKHFTDDRTREGSGHHFAMEPKDWKEMVDRTRELELALGLPEKAVAGNEKRGVVAQRRCLRASRDIKAGDVLTREMIDVLRPATPGAIRPQKLEEVIGTKALVDIPKEKELRWSMLG